MIAKLERTDWAIIASMGAALLGLILAALTGQPWIISAAAFLIALSLAAYGLVSRDYRLLWLLLMGLVAGVLELWADWVHVEHIGSLAYTDYAGLKLLASPLYMPLGWTFTVAQFGYLALRLEPFWGRVRPVLLAAVVGASIPPWYEHLAAPANAWRYISSPTLGHCPWWIIPTYAGCAAGAAAVALLLYRERRWDRAVVAGWFTGALIMLSGVFFYSLLG